MKRIIFYSILIFVFSIGTGYYYASLWKKENISVVEENTIFPQNIVRETVSTEDTLSYNASFALKKYYNDCGHFEINYSELPSELVNLTEDEIERIYSNWEVEEFNRDEVVLAQSIDTMCNEHYVLKLGDENIEIYHIIKDPEDIELYKTTSISKEYLTNADIVNLEEGIYVYGIGNLNSALEDFE